MRKRGLALVATLVACCALAASASADPLPAGDYTAGLTSVSLTAGGPLGTLLGTQTIPLTQVGTVPVTVPSVPGPVTISFNNVSVPPLDLSALAPTLVGSGSQLQLTITSPLTVTADPAAGSGSAQVSGYGTATLSDPSHTYSATCTVGNAASPIAINLSTADPAGAAYNAATGAIKLADSVSLSPLSCDNVSLASLLTGPVKVVLNGQIQPNAGGGSSQQQGQPAGGTKTIQCIVPKVKGKRLAAAKKAIRKAHCKVGHVTKKKSKKRHGRVRSQRPKPGKRLPAGSKVALVVNK